jgi:hypothetical protein
MDFEITSGNARIRGAFYPALQPQSPCLIICHGMPSGPRILGSETNVPFDEGLTYQEIAQLFVSVGIGTVIFNFRGTGASTGDYHPMGWVADLEAVISWILVRPEIDPSNLGILGSSMGAVIAIVVASQREDIRFLVTYAGPSTVTSPLDPAENIDRYRNMGIIRTPGFPHDPDSWAREFDSISPIDQIGKINSDHILLVHGDSDDVVPVEAVYQLGELAPAHTTIHVVEGAGHRFRSESQSIEVIVDWMVKVCGFDL